MTYFIISIASTFIVGYMVAKMQPKVISICKLRREIKELKNIIV